jgi:hypothetical protein
MKGLTRASLLGATLAALSAVAPGTCLAAAAAGVRKAAAQVSPAQLARHIDRALEQRLRSEKVDLSPRAGDAEFLRRVYLDLTGRIPPADKASAFLASKAADKRGRLIDELLASKEYGKHQADIWQGLLLPRNSDNRLFFRYYANLNGWLEAGFNDNKPWDRMARELVTATGPVDRPGPAVYFLANATADKVTDEKLYLTTLSRRPTPDELGRVERYLDKNSEEPRQALADVTWRSATAVTARASSARATSPWWWSARSAGSRTSSRWPARSTSTAGSGCSRRWSRRSPGSNGPTPATPTAPPTGGPST